MNYELKNKTFDGKYQWFYFMVLDILDFLNWPFRLELGSNLTFKNFRVNAEKWNPNSTKYKMMKWMMTCQNDSNLDKIKVFHEIFKQEK